VSLEFGAHNRTSLGELAAAGALVIVPLGSTEQHGPHLPVGTDAWHAALVARRAAAVVASRSPELRLVVAPTMPFASAAMHLPFGGTISLPAALYLEVVGAIGDSLVAGGFRRLYFVNGHGGNHELLEVAVRDLALRHPVVAVAGSWWNVAFDALTADGAHLVAPFPGHAGAFETAFVRAARPDVPLGPVPSRPLGPVDASPDPRRLYALERIARHDFWTAMDGFTDDPSLGTAELGAHWLDVAVAAVADRLEAAARMDLPAASAG
jgi:creatinine amidohydrolase